MELAVVVVMVMVMGICTEAQMDTYTQGVPSR
jgi:hypothetical protein